MNIFLIHNTEIKNNILKKETILHLDPIVVTTENIDLLDEKCDKLHKILISYKDNKNIYKKINNIYNSKCLKK